MKITINDTNASIEKIELTISGYDLADVFWNMDADAQANFFSQIGDKCADNLQGKITSLLASNHLTVNGKDALREISDIIKDQLQ